MAPSPSHTLIVEESPDGGWTIRERGEFVTQRDAVAAARESLAASGGGRLEVRTRTGRVRLHTVPAAGTPILEPHESSSRSLLNTWAQWNPAARVGAVLGAVITLAAALNGAVDLTVWASARVDDLTARRGPSVTATRQLGVEVLQEGSVLPQFLVEGSTIQIVEMDRRPFTLRFPGEAAELAQICAAMDPSVHADIPRTAEYADGSDDEPDGDIYEQTSCLGSARSGARSTFQTDLRLSSSTNNSFFSEAIRAAAGGQEVQVTTISGESSQLDVARISETLYLLIFVDEDGDEHVDFDEFDMLELHF